MNLSVEHATETYRSLISISVEGFKTLLLINGGAVVALLAYLGQSPQGASLAHHVWWPLGCFVIGVFCSAFAFLGSYLTQFSLYNETVRAATYKGRRHMRFLWITLGAVILSLVLFAIGSFSSVWVLCNNTAPKL